MNLPTIDIETVVEYTVEFVAFAIISVFVGISVFAVGHLLFWGVTFLLHNTNELMEIGGWVTFFFVLGAPILVLFVYLEEK